MRDCGIAQWASCELVSRVDIPTQLPTAIDYIRYVMHIHGYR